jgi:DNA-directed RNA polymerase subunit omega
MARITVEDCLQRVSNRFELAVLAARRAKQILRGAPTMLGERYRNRPVVMSLREIAAGHVWPQYGGADVSGSGASGKDKVAAPRELA